MEYLLMHEMHCYIMICRICQEELTLEVKRGQDNDENTFGVKLHHTAVLGSQKS